MEQINIIEFYETVDGFNPVEEFIKNLPDKHGAKVYFTIELLQLFGRNIREPYAKHIEGKDYKGLWELRIKFAGDISRVLYFVPVGNKFVLLHGFVKKTDKTPANELETAKKRMNEYKTRGENNG